MLVNNFGIKGLNDEQVKVARHQHGYNRAEFKKENNVIQALKSIFSEPMVILLLIASLIYLISGDYGNAIFLSSAIVLISIISLYQEHRSQKALDQLKKLSQPKTSVIRNGEVVEILSEEVVVGDSLMVEEGAIITADGVIIHSNDFSVNESILTGESLPVAKSDSSENRLIYQGTTVTTGLMIAEVTAIGSETKLAKIGKSLESIADEKTPLEKQISDFVKKMVIIGVIVFLIVWGVNFLISNDILDSLLKALTLAMSILPEEIPVAFTTFMALGAWRLMKLGIVVKQMKTVESLGSATVICVDKTGTITENRMSIARIYVHPKNIVYQSDIQFKEQGEDLITKAMWASEPIPFDPMEIAIHQAYEALKVVDQRAHFKMIHEYPLGGKPPMMTHLFENEKGERIISAKGAPEAFFEISGLSEDEKERVNQVIAELASDGYRLLGVGEAFHEGNDFPMLQQDFKFKFLGLIAFYDPPKKNIEKVFESFDKAGIGVKIITGDNALTTGAIAKQIHFKDMDKSLSGADLEGLSNAELQEIVKDTYIFTRMFPEAKLKIIEALKANGEVVAMTGDGVNDGPALKSAHIGIAMGKRGTEIAKQAASIVILEDDLSKMVDAITMGRRIYTNLKKAIRYIISIHIPIILVVFIPLVLGWVFPNIFLPAHVILLELIMGPTCSIIYENEPIEKNAMTIKPKPFSDTFFNWEELSTSIFQGLMITIGALLIYQYAAVWNGWNESITRTMVFMVLISSNIFLTLVNRSFYESIVKTTQYKNNLVPLIIGITVIIAALLLIVKPFTAFFKFETLNLTQLLLSAGTGFLFVIWFELVKWKKRF